MSWWNFELVNRAGDGVAMKSICQHTEVPGEE